MPIDIERFESDPEEELKPQGTTNAEVILSFWLLHLTKHIHRKKSTKQLMLHGEALVLYFHGWRVEDWFAIEATTGQLQPERM